MTKTTDGVVLAAGETGSAFLYRILFEATQTHPELAAANLPQPEAFKRNYGDALVRFESARLGSGKRVALAKALRDATLASLWFARQGAIEPLATALQKSVSAPETLTRERVCAPGLRVEVPLDGRLYRDRDVLGAIDQLHSAHHITDAAARALTWVVEHVAAAGGRLDLSSERFVLFGASAELSPAALLLQAGATVRWLDVNAPVMDARAGRIIYSKHADDLLTDPQSVMAAVREFAAQEPVHLGLFAYAPGAGRELRLAGVMDAMVEALGPTVVKSVSFYISPTSPGEVQAEDLAISGTRARMPKFWQRGLQTARMLRSPGHVGTPDSAVARGIISLQGVAYQAAQYLTKIISSEVLATSGLGGTPTTVSGNVAGITNTRSLSHPLFQVGFEGAPLFGVRIFEADTTRALAGLLMLHDLLNPQAPGSATRTFASLEARAKAVRSEQLHGGVYGVPWQFESAVKTAAVIGVGRKPGLLIRRS
jgi:hypothetical protein